MNEDATVQIQPFEAAQAHFQECTIVSAFIAGPFRAKLPAANTLDNRQITVYGLMLRIDSWLRTLCKCDNPSDFQAVSSATRALLEIAVDLVFITHDPSAVEKIHQWEDSGKLKQAKALLNYYSSKKKSPEDISYMEDFISLNQERIDRQRRENGWLKKDKPEHPSRWTNRDLGSDCSRAAKLDSEFDLELFYEEFHRELCWAVHGSGLTLVRNMDAGLLPMLGGRAFQQCADLAQHCARLALKFFGIWDEKSKIEFENLSLRRSLPFAPLLGRLLQANTSTGNTSTGNDEVVP